MTMRIMLHLLHQDIGLTGEAFFLPTTIQLQKGTTSKILEYITFTTFSIEKRQAQDLQKDAEYYHYQVPSTASTGTPVNILVRNQIFMSAVAIVNSR